MKSPGATAHRDTRIECGIFDAFHAMPRSTADSGFDDDCLSWEK
jgi:hypothetical protein